MATFIPYQVDYAVTNAAKTLGFSKKRVSFKFGFANRRALSEGGHLVGPACRGSEHEVVFVWSLKSGKRQLLLDGRDLHFSESGQNGWTADRAWQHAFNLRDRQTGSTYRVLFTTQPTSRDLPDTRPFDVAVDGTSYFRFNPIYQLGTPRMTVCRAATARPPAGGRDSPQMTAEERRQVAQARLESLKDLAAREEAEVARKAAALKRSEEAGVVPAVLLESAVAKEDEEPVLISFDDPPPLPPASATAAQPIASASAGTSAPGNMYFASSITLDGSIEENPPRQQPGSFYGTTGSNPYGAPPPAGGGYPAPSSSYASNPYAATAAPSFASQPGSSNSSSMALTPYNPGQQPQPYVDATGRLSMGQPPQQQQQQDYATGGGGGYYIKPQLPSDYGGISSPSNQTSYSNMTYGSAPSFAQPPQQQQPSSSFAYGAAPSFAPPPASYGAGPAFAQPPPSQQQQQQQYGYPPQEAPAQQQQQQPPSYSYNY